MLNAIRCLTRNIRHPRVRDLGNPETDFHWRAERDADSAIRLAGQPRHGRFVSWPVNSHRRLPPAAADLAAIREPDAGRATWMLSSPIFPLRVLDRVEYGGNVEVLP